LQTVITRGSDELRDDVMRSANHAFDRSSADQGHVHVRRLLAHPLTSVP
jgi:hypothetical protein